MTHSPPNLVYLLKYLFETVVADSGHGKTTTLFRERMLVREEILLPNSRCHGVSLLISCDREHDRLPRRKAAKRLLRLDVIDVNARWPCSDNIVAITTSQFMEAEIRVACGVA